MFIEILIALIIFGLLGSITYYGFRESNQSAERLAKHRREAEGGQPQHPAPNPAPTTAPSMSSAPTPAPNPSMAPAVNPAQQPAQDPVRNPVQ
ncbi:hypothetical protein RNZ50_12100 [Paracoccaceae bacterium Fryx2]|nr:hypothetical protein [Paracoccaceae bacterium Fryx2]